jgi:hypothetical protein
LRGMAAVYRRVNEFVNNLRYASASFTQMLEST